MNKLNDYDDKVDNDLLDWFDSISIKYKNYEIKSAILAHKYLQLTRYMRNINEFSLSKILFSLKWKLKLGLLQNKIPSQYLISIKSNHQKCDLSDKNIYAVNYSPEDSKNFQHILPLVENDKHSLVMTVRNDVYEYFNKIGVKTILLNISNPWRGLRDLKVEVPLHPSSKSPLSSIDILSSMYLSKAASLVDLLEILTNKWGLPRTIITLQDYMPIDSIFAIYLCGKVPTVTLQHGFIYLSRNTLWKYIISDWIIVWGNQQAETLKSLGVSSEKIKVLGTAKYDLVSHIKYDKLRKRERKILISIQPLLSKFFIELLFNFLKVLLRSKENFLLSIRFHPAVSKFNRRQFMRRVKKENIFSNINLEISEIKDPLEDISKSTIVLTSKTTLAFEAMLVGRPVIEYLSKKEDSVKFGDYRDFSLHAFTVEEAENLIVKLLKDDNFYKKIIEKQNKYINSEIIPPPTIPRILNFINSLNKIGG